MKTLSNGHKNCIVDFICPIDHYRQHYDYTIFMNTIEQSKYKDTNSMFELGKPNLEIKNWKYNIKEISGGKKIKFVKYIRHSIL